jgi:hypothetical protein
MGSDDFMHIPGSSLTPYGKRKERKAQRDVEQKANVERSKQEAKIREQETQEKQRLAESTSEVEERKARAKRAGGRSLLIKTSPRGVGTLGGS